MEIESSENTAHSARKEKYKKLFSITTAQSGTVCLSVKTTIYYTAREMLTIHRIIYTCIYYLYLQEENNAIRITFLYDNFMYFYNNFIYFYNNFLKL